MFMFAYFFRMHRSTTYIVAAYCYRPSSVVSRFVCQSVTLAELIKMPFELWARMGPKESCVR